ncbi:MAG: FecR family protein [Pedobacter sp.]|nr:FecR family protein [Pedobacter sp.]
MEAEKLRQLLDKLKNKQCSEEELSLLHAWYDEQIKKAATNVSEDQVSQDLEAVYNRLPGSRKKRSLNFSLPIAASISIILSLSIGLYYYCSQKQLEAGPRLSATGHAALPTTQLGKSFLTLADGRKVSLAEAPIGILAQQQGVQISKLEKDVIEFSTLSPNTANESSRILNVLTTSRAAQFQVILTDGTRIWINAVSSLKFPTTFSGKTRHIELDGEAYFEVAKNKSHPFEVLTRRQQVQVLGTHFNVSSYADEPTTKTTLLEGKVKVLENKLKHTIILRPGEQSTLNEHAKIEVSKVDVDNEVAWRTGLFQFRNSDLANVSRQLARWYNVDFKIDPKIPNIKLWGEVHREDSLEKALEFLTFFDLNYRVLNKAEVKQVIITAKNRQHK